MTKKLCFKTTVLAASLFCMISCNNSENSAGNETAAKPSFNLDDAKKEIAQSDSAFAGYIASGDSVAIANLYSTDAKLMFGGAPTAVGRAAIQSVFAGIINSGVTKVDFKSTDLYGSEELVVQEGEVAIYVKDMVVGLEKFIVLWKKEEGKWKMFRDISNSNTPTNQ